MSRPKFIVQPQRSNGRAWVPCEQHQATNFAVLRAELITRQGRKFTASRVIGRFVTKTQAESFAETNRKTYEPVPRHLIRKLGQRIIAQ